MIVCMRGAHVFPKTAREALRAMGAATQHKAFGIVLLKTQGAVRCLVLRVIVLSSISNIDVSDEGLCGWLKCAAGATAVL